MKRFISILITVIMLAGVIAVPGVTSSAAEITTGTLVTFGSYPQTSVIDKDQLDVLNSQSLDWHYYDYYCDGKHEDFMEYTDVADVFESGDRYRAVRFSHYRPNKSKSAEYNRTEQNNNGYNPGYVYWFKYDPIVWRVLDADEGLLMTENLIDSQPFHNVYYNGYGDVDYKHYATNWAYSSLRSWMNNDFYNAAFNKSESGFIRNAYLNTPSSYSSEYDADSTGDNVFLLSRDDALNGSYGFKSDYTGDVDSNRIAYGTDYARCQGLYVYYSGASWWRLRTPGNYYNTGFVNSDGSVHKYINTDYTHGGIRPALCVDLQSAISQSLIKITDRNNLVINGPSPTYISVMYKSSESGLIAERKQKFDFSKFQKSSAVFDADIAEMSISVAMNAFSPDSDKSVAKKLSDTLIKQMMQNLGFAGDNDQFYYQKKFDAIGARQLSDGTYLILVANRGIGYGFDFGGEWLSNFRVKDPSKSGGYNSYAYGFKSAADKVYSNLLTYIKDHSFSFDNIKIWTTGFSRAAAISNLLAARLIEDTTIGSEDIFAYTFATPYTVRTDMNAGKSCTSNKYSGIHNIVQEIDLVPRVPLASWHFGRYGTTYSLPCNKISGQKYNNLLKDMITVFKKNDFSSEYLYITGQEVAIDLLLDYFDDVIKSSDYYYSSGLQDLIVNYLGSKDSDGLISTLLYSQNATEIFKIITDFDSYNLKQKIVAATKLIYLCVTMEPALVSIVTMIRSFLGNYLAAMIAEINVFGDTKAAKSRLKIYENAMTLMTDLIKADDRFHTKLFMQHWPEVYLSWVQVAMNSGKTNDIFNSNGYVHSRVKCPVDVYIYDGENNIVGKIVNDEVDESITDSVYCSVDAWGEKEFYLPDNGEYTVKIVAREQGEMTVVNEYYNADRDIVSTECYLNMSLSENQEFTQTYDFTDSESKITTGGEEIKPDMTAGSEDDTARTVTVSKYENGTVTGKTNYTLGETASFAAFPDEGYKFEGWYSESGELLSADDYYYFTITENTAIVPKFAKDDSSGMTVTPGDVDGNGQILADDARLALRASAKLEELSEAQLLAADVDGNGQVLADDARQILRFSAKLQQEFIKV